MAARVPYLNVEDLSEENKDLLKRPIWLHRALVNSPDTARAFGVLGGHIRYGMKLDMRLRELAILQVGWIARSPFEWSHHVKLGMDFGVSKEDIEGLIADSEGRLVRVGDVAEVERRARANRVTMSYQGKKAERDIVQFVGQWERQAPFFFIMVTDNAERQLPKVILSVIAARIISPLDIWKINQYFVPPQTSY